MMKKPVSSLANVPVTAPSEPLPPMPVVQRESLHVRIPSETVARIREASHRLRRERQDIADEALRVWLTTHGF